MTSSDRGTGTGGMRNMWRNVRIGVGVLVVAYLVVVILLNREPVETKLLFASVTMPRALLLLLTLAAGFTIGVFTVLLIRRRDRAGSDDQR